jgi:hypothetical protein
MFIIIARHKWVHNCTISESYSSAGNIRRYTATINGWGNWKLYEGDPRKIEVAEIIKKVKEIQNRILSKDVSVFQENGFMIKK